MSDSRIDQLIRGYYASRQPPPERLDDLEASLATRNAGTPRWRRHVLVAACCAISALAGAALALGIARGPRGSVTTAKPAADVIAIQFYAEWCSPSQVVSARVAELGKMDDGRVLFIKLDLTDTRRTEQARLLTSSIGCGHVWEAQHGVTGELVLVDGHSKRIISTLSEDDDADRMRIAVTQALALVAH